MKHPHPSLIQDYFENTLDTGELSRVREHLVACDACTRILAEMAIIESKVKSLSAPRVSAATEARVMASAAGLLAQRRLEQNQRARARQSRQELKEWLLEWQEQLWPQWRSPAWQLCSLSLLVAVLVAYERSQGPQEVYRPITTEVHVTSQEGE